MANIVLSITATSEEIEQQMVERQKVFARVSRSIDRLGERIVDLRVRFSRAYDSDQRPFWYNLHLRILTLEGVLNAHIEYCNRILYQLQCLRVCRNLRRAREEQGALEAPATVEE